MNMYIILTCGTGGTFLCLAIIRADHTYPVRRWTVQRYLVTLTHIYALSAASPF